MSRRDDQRVADIIDAAAELKVIIDQGRRSFDADPILQRAAERLLEIIGEAANSLTAETTGRYPDVPWRDITRLRVVLAHHYHRVDAAQVWAIAADDVPKLVASFAGEHD
ncbi:MAG: DUF86 domain-containing protein [bacterium]|nr:DUF86 domain-containing protein [bacterium]